MIETKKRHLRAQPEASVSPKPKFSRLRGQVVSLQPFKHRYGSVASSVRARLLPHAGHTSRIQRLFFSSPSASSSEEEEAPLSPALFTGLAQSFSYVLCGRWMTDIWRATSGIRTRAPRWLVSSVGGGARRLPSPSVCVLMAPRARQ